MDKKRIGEFIKALRQEKNMSQEDLASVLHISRSSISKWENGTLLPTNEYMHDICNYFNISFNELIYGEKINKDNKNELDDITLNLIHKNNKRKCIIVVLIFVVLILLILFLSYYFISSYKSTKVYNITGVYEDNVYYEGTFIITKEHLSLSLYNVNNSDVSKIKLYYMKEDIEYLIVETTHNYLNIDEDVGYNEYFDIDNIETIINNLYLDVYLSDSVLTIKLDTYLNYVNDNMIYKRKDNGVDSKLDDYLLDLEMINCIKDTFTKTEDDVYTYILDNYEFGYLDKSHTLYLESDEESWYYFLDLAKLYYISEDNSFRYNYANNVCETGDCSFYEEVNDYFWNYFNEVVECS